VHNPKPPISSFPAFMQPLQPSFLLKLQPFTHHQGFGFPFLRLWPKVPENSRISPKQYNYECKRVEVVKFFDKQREKDGLKQGDRGSKTSKIEIYQFPHAHHLLAPKQTLHKDDQRRKNKNLYMPV